MEFQKQHTRQGPLKGAKSAQKSPSRVPAGDEGVARRNGRAWRFPDQGSFTKRKQKKIELVTRPISVLHVLDLTGFLERSSLSRSIMVCTTLCLLWPLWHKQTKYIIQHQKANDKSSQNENKTSIDILCDSWKQN